MKPQYNNHLGARRFSDTEVYTEISSFPMDDTYIMIFMALLGGCLTEMFVIGGSIVQSRNLFDCMYTILNAALHIIL